jgi:hypothetical protein
MTADGAQVKKAVNDERLMVAYTMFRYERDSATATDDIDDAGQAELQHRGCRRGHLNPLDWMT